MALPKYFVWFPYKTKEFTGETNAISRTAALAKIVYRTLDRMTNIVYDGRVYNISKHPLLVRKLIANDDFEAVDRSQEQSADLRGTDVAAEPSNTGYMISEPSKKVGLKEQLILERLAKSGKV